MSGDGFKSKGDKRVDPTDLIIHYGIADILNQTTKTIRVLDVVEETLGLSLFPKQN